MLYEYKMTFNEDRIPVLVKEKQYQVDRRQSLCNILKAYDIFKMFELDRMPEEHMYQICLDARNHPIASFHVCSGGLNSAFIDPRIIFRNCMAVGAVSFMVAHNHPSGDCSPSAEDRMVTKQLIEKGKILDVSLVDHIIISEKGFYSFRESDYGLWKEEKVC